MGLFWAILGRLGLIWVILGHREIWPFWGHSGAILGRLRLIWPILGRLGLIWAFLGRLDFFYGILGPLGLFWAILGRLGLIWAILVSRVRYLVFLGPCWANVCVLGAIWSIRVCFLEANWTTLVFWGRTFLILQYGHVNSHGSDYLNHMHALFCTIRTVWRTSRRGAKTGRPDKILKTSHRYFYVSATHERQTACVQYYSPAISYDMCTPHARQDPLIHSTNLRSAYRVSCAGESRLQVTSRPVFAAAVGN